MITTGPMGKDLVLEKIVLRLLCAGTPEGAVRDALIPMIRDYAWRSTLHHAIFDAVRAAPSSDPRILCQLLPAKLTRMGFPDVDWDEIFSQPSTSRDEAIAIVQKLLAGA